MEREKQQSKYSFNQIAFLLRPSQENFSSEHVCSNDLIVLEVLIIDVHNDWKDSRSNDYLHETRITLSVLEIVKTVSVICKVLQKHNLLEDQHCKSVF